MALAIAVPCARALADPQAFELEDRVQATDGARERHQHQHRPRRAVVNVFEQQVQNQGQEHEEGLIEQLGDHAQPHQPGMRHDVGGRRRCVASDVHPGLHVALGKAAEDADEEVEDAGDSRETLRVLDGLHHGTIGCTAAFVSSLRTDDRGCGRVDYTFLGGRGQRGELLLPEGRAGNAPATLGRLGQLVTIECLFRLKPTMRRTLGVDRLILLVGAYDKSKHPSAMFQGSQIKLARKRLADWLARTAHSR